tara:strand:+ start:3954 stop:5159 length:1206 start_codon:yes stop_codon:yes gene_type:complete
MSNTNNNLELYKAVSIISIGVVVTFTILLLFVPVFSSNYFYEVGTVLVYSGKIADIPKGWALCDGRTIEGVQTPNLMDKFVIGAWSSNLLPHVEKTNNRSKVEYIGNGFDPKLIKNSDNIIKRNALGMMTGQIPFTFGTNYSHSTIINGTDLKNKSVNGSDHGTNWFKKYKNNNINACSKTTDNNPENFVKYYRNQEFDTDLCSGLFTTNDGTIVKDDKFILNDFTMMKEDKRITIANGNPTNPDFKYYYNTNSISNSEFPSEYELQTVNIQVNQDGLTEQILENPIESSNSVSHVPIKRRLFRDYEDYKILLEEGKRLGVSCYDCLPMNHKFTSHNYTFGNGFDEYVNTKVLENNPTNNIHLLKKNKEIRLKEYMNNIVYEKPYTNNPSFFKLAYIIRIK